MSSTRRTLTTVAMVALVAGVWLVFAPRQLGGTTTYVSTFGISMEPTFHRGDLALVRPQEHYHVGDVVAFHSDILGVVVLHRLIVAHDDGTFTTRGDNNNFDDPEPAAPSAIIGKLWIRIGHGGDALKLMVKPSSLVILASLTLLVGSMNEQAKRGSNKRKRSQAAKPQASTTWGRSTLVPPELVPWPAALAAAALVLGGFAFSKPTTVPAGRTAVYSQDLTFGYEATVQPNVVYPDGHVRWGDPIYTELVDELTIQVAFAFHGLVTAPVQGTLTLDAELLSADGWHRSLDPVPATTFTDQTATAAVVLDLNKLRAILTEVEAISGSPPGGVTVTVTARVEASTAVAGQTVQTTASAPLTLGLGSTQVTVSDAASPSTTSTGKVDLPDTKANHLTLSMLSLPVLWGRALAIVWGLAAIAVGVSATASARKLAALGSRSAKVSHHYRNRIVLVQDLGSESAVDVVTAEDFFRLADQTQEAVLRCIGQGCDIYQIEYGTSRYRYTVYTSKSTDNAVDSTELP